MTRKSFIARLLKAWTAVISLPVAYVIGSYIRAPRQAAGEEGGPVSAGRRAEYDETPVRFFRAGDSSFYVRRTPDGRFEAFSAKCTHLACLVEYRREESHFRCNCHGSIFDLAGGIVTGPAPSPLDPYRVELSGEEIIVTVL